MLQQQDNKYEDEDEDEDLISGVKAWDEEERKRWWDAMDLFMCGWDGCLSIEISQLRLKPHTTNNTTQITHQPLHHSR